LAGFNAEMTWVSAGANEVVQFAAEQFDLQHPFDL
jgi:hypothetical protein